MKAILRIGGLLSALAAGAAVRAQMTDVLTYHNDNLRTGQGLHEEILSPANVNTNHFGKLWILPADGKVDGQPLYAAGVPIPGRGLRNVLYVVTEHDSVYAYDADSTNLFWRVSMLLSKETTSDSRSCGQVVPEIGITSTPAIDRQLGSNGTIFVVAMSKSGTAAYFQRLHALDLGTGQDRVPPVTVSASYPSSSGTVTFDPAQYKERAGLLLLNGVVYTAWSSHCDITPYTGWIMGYDEATLAQTTVLNVTPNGSRGAVWMAGGGLCADTNGFIYFLDANGTFDTSLGANGFPAQNDFGNAFLKLSTSSNKLAVADYFANDQNVSENENDGDLGSGGSILLPDLTDADGNARQLAVGAGKDANIYVVDRQNLGKYSSKSNVNYQTLSGALAGGVFSVPAYFNGVLYYGAVGDRLKAFPFANARLLSAASESSIAFPSPGATPSISANGSSNGIVWATENTSPAVLFAFNATNLAQQLYGSSQAANGRDNFGAGNKFITPAIASARVYAGATSGVGVFGLLDETTLTPIEIWRNTNFGNPSNVGAGANDASPSGDGVPNLLKYALGLNPSVAVTLAQLPAGSLQTNSGQSYLTLAVNRAADPPDVSLVVQVSSDLVNWSANTVTLTNTPAQLVARDSTPFSTSNARFMRLTAQP
ncbi:MAG: pyrrolo-quinoline quinone [Limisphaerales bacterium]